MIRVLIVDDHPVVRDGLRGRFDDVPGIAIVGDAGDALTALDLVTSLSPDVVLMDLRMPGLDGADAVARLRSSHPSVKALVLTTYDTDTDIARALAAGAIGYLLKDAPRAELHAAVRETAQGRRVLSPSIAALAG